MEEVQGVKWCVSWEEARFIFEAIEEDISVYIVLNQFCCTVVKRGSLVLRIK